MSGLSPVGLIRSQLLLFCVMPLFAIGASTLPTLLGHIVDQVSARSPTFLDEI